ncbi:MAG: Na/Pi cotransporter family protein [Spirochaetales bacterium]|nr:Na/Pi cotransporter family protein [Spirochaetales bacterium]
MDFFDILTMIGGLSLFLFGMNVMGQYLKRRAGNSLKYILGKLTDNPFTGFLTGLAATAVVQSSSATTVMVVGFVNSGIMTLRQSMSIIMGANVGTTVTAWILSLSGISGGNFFLQMLKPSSFSPILALVGVIMLIGGKSSKRRDTGTILLGFATLMFGLETMAGAVAGLKEVPAFQNLLVSFSNPVLGVLVGAAITALLQSSSASVGILQSFALSGLITYGATIPMVMGMNIGACVPTLISSMGTNTDARRSAMYHLVFNIIGAAVWLAVYLVVKSVASPAFIGSYATPLGIAIYHTTYKLLCVLILMPLSGPVKKLVCALVKQSDKQQKVSELDDRLLKTPALALQRCKVLMDEMAKASVDSITKSLASMNSFSEAASREIHEKEDLTDHYEDIIGTYLVKLSSQKIGDEDSMTAGEYLRMITDLERIADHSVHVIESVREKDEKNIVFSPDAQAEIDTIVRAINHITLLAYNAFVNSDLDSAFKVEPLEQVVDFLKEEIRKRHIRRLQKGECSIEAGFILNDILTSMERVSDHCSNIAGCIIDAGQHNLNLHETLNEYKHNSQKFDAAYSGFLRQYELPGVLKGTES